MNSHPAPDPTPCLQAPNRTVLVPPPPPMRQVHEMVRDIFKKEPNRSMNPDEVRCTTWYQCGTAHVPAPPLALLPDRRPAGAAVAAPCPSSLLSS